MSARTHDPRSRGAERPGSAPWTPPCERYASGRLERGRGMQHASPDGSPARRAVLELAALEKRDFDEALQRILRADADALHVDRVGFWSLADDGAALSVELGYVRSLGAFERGVSISASDYPEYFEALHEEQFIIVDDALGDHRTRRLRD